MSSPRPSRDSVGRDDGLEKELLSQLDAKIALGSALIGKFSCLMNVRGIDKLERKIMQEVRFLTKIFKNRTFKKEHLMCTNLNRIEAMVEFLMTCRSVTAVLQAFRLPSEQGANKKLVVDIICNSGGKWIKVIARNPKALTQLSKGNGEFGQRSVVDQVKEYVDTAKAHPYMYKPPEVVFHFASGVESTLAEQLLPMGITISGCIIEHTDDVGEDYGLSSLAISDEPVKVFSTADTDAPLANTSFSNNNGSDKATRVLNLDVTTMLAYVSALTNAHPSSATEYLYKHPVLLAQLECEKHEPVKPMLDKLFEGKELVCCQSAANSFHCIVNRVAGPNERSRAQDLMSKVKVVPDCATHPVSSNLKPGGKIRARSLTVFNTGHNLKAITVSANEGLVRAAANQGVDFAVFIHPARALTEGKMLPQMDAQHADG